MDHIYSILFSADFTLNLSSDLVLKINERCGLFSNLPLCTLMAINNNQDKFNIYCDSSNEIRSYTNLADVLQSYDYKMYFPDLNLYGTVKSAFSLKKISDKLTIQRIVTKYDDAQLLLPRTDRRVYYNTLTPDHDKFLVLNNIDKCESWLSCETSRPNKPIPVKIYYDKYCKEMNEDIIPKKMFSKIVNQHGLYRVGSMSNKQTLHVIPLLPDIAKFRILLANN